jgi:hypothetical protein
VFASAHAGVGGEEDLEFAPPFPAPLGGGSGEGVDDVMGWDLGFGDGVVVVVGVEVVAEVVDVDGPPGGAGLAGPVGSDAAEDVLAGEEEAFFEAGVDQGRDGVAEVFGDRRAGRLVQDALEVGGGEGGAADEADGGGDVEVAVALLFAAVAFGPSSVLGGRRWGSR